MKNFSTLWVAVYLLFTNCTHSSKKIEFKERDIPVIDIITNLSNNKKVNLSDIASNIEYCTLETDKKCLITGNNFIYSSKSYIVAVGMECYVFDRKTGSFIRQISRRGQGPCEYLDPIFSFWDGDKEQICTSDGKQFLFFNLDGTLSHKADRFKSFGFEFVAYKDFYVGYVLNSFGDATSRVAFYNKSGALIDSIPNYRSWKKTRDGYGYSSDNWLYVFQNGLYYKDIYCDTLYYISDFTLQPRYVFNTGGLAVPYEIQEGGRYDFIAARRGGEYDKYEKYIVIFKIFEDNKRIYFTFDYRKFRYPAIYYKAENKLQIMLPATMPHFSGNMKVPRYGFENDLDGGLLFWPQQIISDTEMMCVYTAEELLGLDASKITDEKLKNVLNSLNEESNPVVAIITLKQ